MFCYIRICDNKIQCNQFLDVREIQPRPSSSRVSSIFGRLVPEIAILSAPEFATYRNLSISSFQNLQFKMSNFFDFGFRAVLGAKLIAKFLS